ncbi:helix-turn-helix domain-containing protein [Nonomuraea sp. NPDC047897]
MPHLRTGKGKAIRFSTLTRLCEVLECRRGDLLRYTEDPPPGS